MMKNIDNIPFIFIVGRPRSGTTLLRTLFDAHPNVAIPPECQFIVNLYPKYGKVINWNENDILDFYNELIHQWLFDTWKIDEEKLKNALLEYKGKTSYATMCKVVYLQYTSLFRKEDILLFGDKNPGYTIYTRLLQEIFPNAKFIHIIRDYRDNFVSIRNVDFELPFPSMVVQKWKYFYKRFEKDSKTDTSKYCAINYEALVSNPEKEMKSLCEFTGIKFTDEIFNFHLKKDEFLKAYPPGYIQSYHSSLIKKINTGKIGVWKHELKPYQVKMMDVTAGKVAELAGYKREYTGNNIWFHIIAFPGRLLAWLLSIALKIVDGLPYKLRTAILLKGPLFLAKVFLLVFKPKKYREMKYVITKKKK